MIPMEAKPKCGPNGCGRVIKKESNLILVSVGGRVLGAYHRKCNKQRRYELSYQSGEDRRSDSLPQGRLRDKAKRQTRDGFGK